MRTKNRSTETPSPTNPSSMFERPASRGMLLASAFLVLLGACGTPQMADAGEKSVKVKGRVLVGDRAPGRVRLFFAAQRPSRRSVEIPTNATGEFETALAPGIYRIRASPTTACPIRNTLVIPPSQSGPLSIVLKTTPLGFFHCAPSHMTLASASNASQSRPESPTRSIEGFWAPAPKKPVTMFLDADPSNGSLRQIDVDPKGHFQIGGLASGAYTLVATVSGFCPVSVRFTIVPETRYLVLTVSAFRPGSPCIPAKASLHDTAFALP